MTYNIIGNKSSKYIVFRHLKMLFTYVRNTNIIRNLIKKILLHEK